MEENNKKYEHLFSQDPIGAFEKIEQDYIRYFKAAYKIDDMYKIGEKCLDDERVDLLKKDDNMSKEPYIEILPKYSSVNLSKEDLINKFKETFGDKDAAERFFKFVSLGLMPKLMEKYIPYGHQIGMMDKACAGIDENGNQLKYKNTVVTSGTGSGKTESFLLPLFADIYKEAVAEGWKNKDVDHKEWYKGEKMYSPKQREGDKRPAAVRALVLYPMNALVEDQIARLRKALDSDDVRKLFDKELNGNRIYFGSYNGATIAKKNYELLEQWANGDREKVNTFDNIKKDVADKLSKIHSEYQRILDTTEKPEDALYISPRLGGGGTTAEMVTRWDMQKWAPDIMITNTSMLSVMLMRKAESPIFEQTKRWLAAEDIADKNEREKVKKHRIFHIVVDELHLYRGTAGSEVACLLRMLYNAIGLKPIDENGNPNPQIKILASSASLGNEDQTQKFLEEFFGLYSTNGEKVFNIQSGSNYIDTLNKESDKTIDYTKFSIFTHENFVAIDKDVDVEDKEKVKEIYNFRLDKINEFVKEHFACENIEDFINKYQGKIFYDFYKVMPENNDGDPDKKKKPSIRPISQNELKDKLFDGNEDALRGFLIFRGFIDNISDLKHNLPQFRFHKFFKYIEGLWGELHPTFNKDGKSPIGNLSYTAQEIGLNGRKVLELLRCESCGQVFIGGNRKKDGRRSSLTLNYPNLNQIPNFNPTPMVQNKTYKDYAIFWPNNDLNTPISLHTGHSNQGAADHVVVIENGTCNYDNGYAKWIPGYLDSVTGEFVPKTESVDGNGDVKKTIKENGISGFLYRVDDTRDKDIEITDEIAKKIYAVPCTCPHCLQDYTSRTYTKSPIRSFRTGIDRSNQILSKELICQLDEKSAKLIGFSDSREDAAKQALGIEKEHYRDMVRMLFVEYVNEMGIDEIQSFVKKCREEGKKWSCIKNEVRERWVVRNDIDKVVDAIRNYMEDDDDTGLDGYRENIIKLSDLIGNNFDGILVKKLLEKGINPAGESYGYQWYREEGNNEMFHWSKAYDFDNLMLRNIRFDPNTHPKYATEIKKQLESAVFANSFGKYMGVSVLDAGIGYICGPQSDAIENSQEYRVLEGILSRQGIDVYEFVDAFIRILGDNYYYTSNCDNDRNVNGYDDLKAVVKRHIRNFFGDRYNANTPEELELGGALVNYLRNHNIVYGNWFCLDINNLCFRRMTDEKYIECPKCHRVHPNIGSGFCTKCMEKLDPQKTVKTEELHKHYISHDILIEKKRPRRLHTEELSGQTDDIQSRLREFKDLILVDNNDANARGQKLTKPIDMVCVTTTMEVGVDIGSLQAIFQGNMPPTRYNYQQRVGRGGRRGQAYSTAFTFCRGRSHDVYYYNKATDEMVGGIPATPTLSLAPYNDGGKTKMKLAILKRVIVKEILKQAYAELPFEYKLQDTVGEFGFVYEWYTETKAILEEWIKNNEVIISDIVNRYFDQFNVNGEIKGDIDNITNWIKNNLLPQIDTAVSKTTAKDKGLAQYLAESGFLPMYGMPSDSRKFYHGYDYERKKVKSVDRSSELAISEFAPGAEKTKDKAKYRVEGITVSMKEDAPDKDNIDFFDNYADALKDSYVLSFEKDVNGCSDNNFKDVTQITDHNGIVDYYNQLCDKNKERILVIPQAYRSLEIGNNTGTPVDNNDRGSSFVQTQIFAKDNSTHNSITKKDVGNVSISIFEMGLNEDPTIWHINTNNGYFYKGNYNATGMDKPRGGLTNFMFYDCNNNNKVLNKKTDGIDIALGSKKVTEMIKLELKGYPENLNLDLGKGNRSAIRAAFYSAAFLLQRALADKLDVQPDEIEICEKIDGTHVYPSIYLSDALPNGAGIVGYLYQDDNLEKLIRSIVDFKSFDENTPLGNSFMQSIISDDHRENCLTACQKCLMTYNNRGFHHILDWRLGIGILRLMLDKTYDFGFTEVQRNKYEELKDWNKIVELCYNKLHVTPENQNDIIVYHPLWNIAQTGKAMYNTFKLLRSDLTEDNPGQPPKSKFGSRGQNNQSSNDSEKQLAPTVNSNAADIPDDVLA